MDLGHPNCAGLDAHQKTIVACARIVAVSTVIHETETFGTTTRERLALADWLEARGVTHVAKGIDRSIWEADLAHPGRTSAGAVGR
jgi:transposase